MSSCFVKNVWYQTLDCLIKRPGSQAWGWQIQLYTLGIGRSLDIAPIDAKFQDLSFGKGPGAWFFENIYGFCQKTFNF